MASGSPISSFPSFLSFPSSPLVCVSVCALCCCVLLCCCACVSMRVTTRVRNVTPDTDGVHMTHTTASHHITPHHSDTKQHTRNARISFYLSHGLSLSHASCLCACCVLFVVVCVVLLVCRWSRVLAAPRCSATERAYLQEPSHAQVQQSDTTKHNTKQLHRSWTCGRGEWLLTSGCVRACWFVCARCLCCLPVLRSACVCLFPLFVQSALLVSTCRPLVSAPSVLPTTTARSTRCTRVPRQATRHGHGPNQETKGREDVNHTRYATNTTTTNTQETHKKQEKTEHNKHNHERVDEGDGRHCCACVFTHLVVLLTCCLLCRCFACVVCVVCYVFRMVACTRTALFVTVLVVVCVATTRPARVLPTTSLRSPVSLSATPRQTWAPGIA